MQVELVFRLSLCFLFVCVFVCLFAFFVYFVFKSYFSGFLSIRNVTFIVTFPLENVLHLYHFGIVEFGVAKKKNFFSKKRRVQIKRK